jgi:manganese/zinc/iron transport system permease protein
MVAVSADFGALAGVSGAVISSSTSHMPTGPTIVLCISAIVVISLLFAPNRGLIWNRIRQQRNRSQLQVNSL